jgi:urease accessory protein
MLRPTVALALLASATPALAHTGAGAAHGFGAGLAHPLLGLDHLLAMMAVGLWAALAGGRAVWAWPAAFVVLMVLGAGAAVSGIAAPGVDVGIALSVVGLGLLVALRLPVGVTLGAAVCGAFALFHGHAHGSELPAGAGAGAYIAGFVLATASLHAAGVALGLGIGRVRLPWIAPLAGGAVAMTGLALLAG